MRANLTPPGQIWFDLVVIKSTSPHRIRMIPLEIERYKGGQFRPPGCNNFQRCVFTFAGNTTTIKTLFSKLPTVFLYITTVILQLTLEKWPNNTVRYKIRGFQGISWLTNYMHHFQLELFERSVITLSSRFSNLNETGDNGFLQAHTHKARSK